MLYQNKVDCLWSDTSSAGFEAPERSPGTPPLLLHMGSQHDSSTPMTRHASTRIHTGRFRVGCTNHSSRELRGPQGSWALWALTFYNPNSVYHYESDDTWRDSWLVRKQHIGVSRGGM